MGKKNRHRKGSGVHVKPSKPRNRWKTRKAEYLHEPVVTVVEPSVDQQRYAPHRTRMYVLKRDKYKCRYCGVPVTNETANMDHVIPWKLGGKSVARNLVTACRDCNRRKGNSHWQPNL